MMLILFLGLMILSLYIAFKFEGIFHKIISVGAIASIFTVLLFRDYTILMISYFIFFLMQTTTLAYGIFNQKISLPDRISIVSMGLFFSLKSLSQLLHFPFANQMILSLSVPMLLFLAALVYNRSMRKELSFMIFWFFYAAFDIYNMMEGNLHQHQHG